MRCPGGTIAIAQGRVLDHWKQNEGPSTATSTPTNSAAPDLPTSPTPSITLAPDDSTPTQTATPISPVQDEPVQGEPTAVDDTPQPTTTPIDPTSTPPSPTITVTPTPTEDGAGDDQRGVAPDDALMALLVIVLLSLLSFWMIHLVATGTTHRATTPEK